MVFRAAKKVYKKFQKGGVRKVAKYAGKKVYRRYSSGGLSQVAKDVSYLKGLINVEKKYAEASYSNLFGQTNGNASGVVTIDVTPAPAQNVAFNGRTGQSVKLVSATMNIIINAQADQDTGCRIRFEIYSVKGDPKTATLCTTELYDSNPLTTIIDAMSNRNPNNYSDYKLICKRSVWMPATQHAGTIPSQRQKNLKINLKLNHHLRFDKNTTTLVSGQIVIIAFADSGNASSLVASTQPYIQNPQVSTGFQYNMWTRFYYVDN